MIEIDGKIISLDLFTQYFMCDIAECKGMCCVEGSAGAPLEENEIAILKEEYENYRHFMTDEGVAEIERSGFAVTDADGDLTTPLVDGVECAYSFDENGVTLCAIEKAWKEGRTKFRKPVSCHLYPIRVMKFRNGSMGLNYHRWNVCVSAVKNGEARGVPVYKALKEPIVRCFGEEFYEAMEAAEAYLKDNPV